MVCNPPTACLVSTLRDPVILLENFIPLSSPNFWCFGANSVFSLTLKRNLGRAQTLMQITGQKCWAVTASFELQRYVSCKYFCTPENQHCIALVQINRDFSHKNPGNSCSTKNIQPTVPSQTPWFGSDSGLIEKKPHFDRDEQTNVHLPAKRDGPRKAAPSLRDISGDVWRKKTVEIDDARKILYQEVDRQRTHLAKGPSEGLESLLQELCFIQWLPTLKCRTILWK